MCLEALLVAFSPSTERRKEAGTVFDINPGTIRGTRGLSVELPTIVLRVYPSTLKKVLGLFTAFPGTARAAKLCRASILRTVMVVNG